jgi:hypothetical protein
MALSGMAWEQLEEPMARTLASLLEIIDFEARGRPVAIDGFCRRNRCGSLLPLEIEDTASDPDPFYPTHYFRNNEPRFEAIQDIITALLGQIALVSGDRIVEPDGFRLKDLTHWLVPGKDDPGAVLNSISWVCGVQCVFCYERGNPPEMNFPRHRTTRKEIMTSVKHFDPERGKRLPIPSRYDNNEILTFPGILDIVGALREKTDAPILNISTNGTMLDEDFVRRLAEHRPILLGISLNSADPGVRASIMKERRPEIPLQSLALLKKYRIPYAVSIVAWNTVPLSDLESTVAYADPFDPLQVRICLPGHTRRFSEEKLFDVEDLWGRIIGAIETFRPRYETPVIPLPYTYEAFKHGRISFLPEVGGVIKNSPAWKAGLRAGDEIISVNRVMVRSRRFLQSLMDRLAGEHTKILWMKIKRHGKEEEKIIRFDPETFDYRFPYLPETRHFELNYYGMFLYDGFDPADAVRLRDAALATGARKVLVLTSWMIRPYLELALSHIDTGGVRFDPVIPENLYMGGNIVVGDLLTIRDFIHAIREYSRDNGKPDLAVVPSSPFSPWLRDLRNEHCLKIERATGVPLYLIDTPKLWS